MKKPHSAAPAAARRPAPKRTGKPARSSPGKTEFSIDELARAGSSTVRNVRAYQDRGLLPPPERRGRNGIYTQEHLARLRLIGRMLERGYTLSNIAELIAAWEQGRDLQQLMGLEAQLTRPWSDEQPISMSLVELAKAFGGNYRPSDLARVLELGLVERDGLRFRVPSPKMLAVGGEIVNMGIPLRELLNIVGGLRRNVERVADELIQIVVKSIDRYGDGLPPAEDVPRLAEMVARLRPLADKAIESEVSRAMERALSRFLGDRLAQVLDHLPQYREPR
ncbi:MAG TPA: MerR family transcriptional regulator [Nevskia sp.]|nr:MerR family transcriptional regulator [Nevskia sp.]